MKGGSKAVVVAHKHAGVFISKSKEDALCTKNMVPGESVYGEKRVSVQNEDGTKVEYRVWNPFRSKLAAAVLGGVDNIWIAPGTRVLYLGAASGTTVSHVSDIVGPDGLVYAVEFSHRSGRDLVNMAKKRTNVIPIIEDARHPARYRMLVGMVDVIFSDVAQPDQVPFPSSLVSESLGCHIVELSVVYPRSLPLYSFDFDLAILSLASDDHTRIPLQDINWMMQIRVSDASCAQCQTYLYLLCAIPISLFCFIG